MLFCTSAIDEDRTDFSECFENTFFLAFPQFLLVLPLAIHQATQPLEWLDVFDVRRTPIRHRLFVGTKFAISLLLALKSLVTIIFAFAERFPEWETHWWLANVSGLLVWTTFMYISVLQWQACVYHEGFFLCLASVAVSIAAVLRARTVVAIHQEDQSLLFEQWADLSYFLYPIAAFCVSYPHTYFLRHHASLIRACSEDGVEPKHPRLSLRSFANGDDDGASSPLLQRSSGSIARVVRTGGKSVTEAATFSWLNSMMTTAKLRTLEISDVAILAPRDAVSSNAKAVRDAWEIELVRADEEKRDPSLFRTLHMALGRPFYLLGGLKLIVDVLGFTGPLLLHLLVSYVDGDAGDKDASYGYMLASIIAVTALLRSCLLTWYSYGVSRVSMLARSGLMSLLYDKILVSRPQDSACGVDINNLVSTDVDRLQNLFPSAHECWSLPLQIIVALYLLFLQVHVAFLAGVFVVLLLIPVNRALAVKIGDLSALMMKQKDTRVGFMTEILSAVFSLKVYSLERWAFWRVCDARSAEVDTLRRRKYLDSWCVYFWATTPVVISVATFTIYAVVLQRTLTAANVFTSIALFSTLIGPLNAFPWVVNGLMESFVSAKRMATFLSRRNIEARCHREMKKDHGVVVRFSDCVFAWNDDEADFWLRNGDMGAVFSSTSGSAEYDCKGSAQESCNKDGSNEVNENKEDEVNEKKGDGYSSPCARAEPARANEENMSPASGPVSCASDRRPTHPPSQPQVFVLRIPSLSIYQGQLIGVCGYVGSGKTAFLQSLLGETVRIRGSLAIADLTKNNVAYVAQTPWLMSGTVRNNILFGARFDPEWYYKVVQACCLEEDFNELPHGDGSNIGEGGTALSGGQRQRVALARAVYANRDIYLLDDVLSAVDASVATEIFQRCIIGLLRGKTRFLCMHHVEMLKEADCVLALEGGRIMEVGSYDELSQHGVHFKKLLYGASDESGNSTRNTGTALSPKDASVRVRGEGSPSSGARVPHASGDASSTGRENKHCHDESARSKTEGGRSRGQSRGEHEEHSGGGHGGRLHGEHGGGISGRHHGDRNPTLAPLSCSSGAEGVSSRRGEAGNVGSLVDLDEADDAVLTPVSAKVNRFAAGSPTARLPSALSTPPHQPHEEQPPSSAQLMSDRGRSESLPHHPTCSIGDVGTSDSGGDGFGGGGVGGGGGGGENGVGTSSESNTHGQSNTSSSGIKKNGVSFSQSLETTHERRSSVMRKALVVDIEDEGEEAAVQGTHATPTACSVSGDDGDGSLGSRCGSRDHLEDSDTAANTRLGAATGASGSGGDGGDSAKSQGADELSADETDEERRTELEHREFGAVRWSVYQRYYLAVGVGLSTLVFVSLVLMQASRNACDLWLSYWVAHEKDSGSRTNYYLGWYIGLGVANSLFTLLRAFAFAYGGLIAAKVLHDDVLKTVLRAKMYFFQHTPVGRILNRFSADQFTVDDTLPFILNIFLANLFGALGSLVIVCHALPYLIGLILPLSMVYYATQDYYRHTSREVKRLESASRAPVFTHISNTREGLCTIRAFGPAQEERFRKLFRQRLDANQRTAFAGVAVSHWLSLRMQCLGACVVAGVASFAVFEHTRQGGGMRAGDVGLSLSYAFALTPLLAGLLTSFIETEREMISVERLKQYESLPTEPVDQTYALPGAREMPAAGTRGGWKLGSKGDASRPLWPTVGAIRFDDVWMAYTGSTEYALRGITFNVTPGEKIGIVGRTGSGKSSLLVALFRLEEPTGGRIEVDYMDTCLRPLTDLRAGGLAMIPQTPMLFSGTLRANVDPENRYSDADVADALRVCHLQDLAGQPMSMHAHVSSGGKNFSIGQRQLVCLARAVLRRPKILCIDEATSSVDAHTEALIQDTLSDAFVGCTVLTIAHRMRTVLQHDRIIVISAGKVVESGPPSSLLSRPGGYFARLVRQAPSQSPP
eukprot:Rmarinus@m.20889